MTLDEQQAILDEYASHTKNRVLVQPRPYALQLFPPEGARILDVGAYLGANLLYYANLGFEIVGVEAARTYCDRFAEELKKYPTLKKRAKMICGMVETVKIPGRFQAVLAGEVLCYTPDPQRMMTRIAALCDPGGVLLATMPKEAQQEFPSHFTLVELEALVRSHKFRPVFTNYLPGWGNSLVSAVRAIREED